MSFELVQPGKSVSADAMQPGTVSFDKRGTLCIRVEDLAEVKVESRVAVLADKGNLRLALRAACDGEGGHVVGVVNRGDKPTNRRRIGLARAIGVLGLDPKAVAGRYRAERKDQLVIINLLPDTSDRRAAARK